MPHTPHIVAERMIPGSSLDALAARWAARPEPGVFAALAEGLAKRGDLAEAGRVVATGLARYPGHAAGLIGQARIAAATGDQLLAERALAILLERDPGHPLAREMAAELAPGLLVDEDDRGTGGATAADIAVPDDPPVIGDALELEVDSPPAEPAPVDEAPADSGTPEPDDSDPQPEPEAVPILTESLAALYHRQGHLEEALAAYAELAARDPSNDTVAAQHEVVRRELASQRPLPFDANESGGRSVATWLGAVAAVRPATGAGEASFDAFFESPPAPANATADFDAFQRWLQELAR